MTPGAGSFHSEVQGRKKRKKNETVTTVKKIWKVKRNWKGVKAQKKSK